MRARWACCIQLLLFCMLETVAHFLGNSLEPQGCPDRTDNLLQNVSDLYLFNQIYDLPSKHFCKWHEQGIFDISSLALQALLLCLGTISGNFVINALYRWEWFSCRLSRHWNDGLSLEDSRAFHFQVLTKSGWANCLSQVLHSFEICQENPYRLLLLGEMLKWIIWHSEKFQNYSLIITWSYWPFSTQIDYD